MEVIQNRFLKALSILIGPLIIAISQFFFQDSWIYPVIMILVLVFIFFVIFKKTPKIIYSSFTDGILISGSKTGLYDPDFVLFNDISSVDKVKRNISITTTYNTSLELHIPKKWKDAVFNDIIKNIS